MVDQYVVDPLLRLSLFEIQGLRIEPQLRLKGAGIADYGLYRDDALRGIVEVKLGVQRRRNADVEGSPDLAQTIRYAAKARTPAMLVDANTIYLIQEGGARPTTTLERRTLSTCHLAAIAAHFFS